MITLRVTLEEIIFWILEEEPVDWAAEGSVRLHDPVERCRLYRQLDGTDGYPGRI